MSLLIDVHAHLDHAMLINNIAEIIKRAENAGLKHVLTNGINPETNRMCLQLSKKYEIVVCAMGVYPKNSLKKEVESGEYPSNFADYRTDEEIDFIRKNRHDITAIGEIGLDFVHGKNDQQINDFKKMIALAEELRKPIIVHSRKAEQKCIEALESSSLKKVIMHCFSGKKALVKRITDNGWFLTVPTIVVRSQQFQDIAKNIPITQLFCETDSPYLSPYKGESNEPAYVLESYKKIAQLKQIELVEVINNIYMNWQRMFE
ncbi:MAG: TatD family hydrolase [Nanoarchaeota archaeon]|mgnify:CR=1 FL=1